MWITFRSVYASSVATRHWLSGIVRGILKTDTTGVLVEHLSEKHFRDVEEVATVV